jgi:hypothetical protein
MGRRYTPSTGSRIHLFKVHNTACLHVNLWNMKLLLLISSEGLITSGGIMVNYLYDMSRLKDRAESVSLNPENIHVSEMVKSLL